MMNDKEKALQALSKLAPWRCEDREHWLKVGIILHSVGPCLLTDWDEWSHQSDKYNAGECERLWSGFNGDGRLGIGTLLRWAKEDEGQSKPAIPPPPSPRHQRYRHNPITPPSTSLDLVIKAAAKRVGGNEFARWFYHNANGNEVLCVVRFEIDNGKTYRQFKRDRRAWVEGGLDGKCPLYGLLELRDAKRVYVVEGERAADGLRALGLTATTSIQGAQSAKKTDWTPLIGREIVILPDNDRDGTKYADSIVKILSDWVPTPEIKIVSLPNLPEKGDVVDFIKARRGRPAEGIRSEIESFVDSTQPIDLTTCCGGPVLVNLADVLTEPVEWLWPGRIALGKLTLIAGDPGLGKSFLTLDIAARVSTGTPWPDDPSKANKRGSVILLNIEDDLGDTIAPRLKASGADSSRIVALKSVTRSENGKLKEYMFSLESDLPALEEAIKNTAGVRLVIIDPLTAFCGSADSHKNAEIRGLLSPLAELAARYKVAILAVSHLNKNSAGPAIYRSIGSIAFTATARAVWAVTKDREDEQRRLFLPIKNNLAIDNRGLAYRLEASENHQTARVAWEDDPVEITADEAFSCNNDQRRSLRNEAREYLYVLLGDGPVSSTDVIDQAKEHGFSEKTIRRAAEDMGVEKKKLGQGGWVWQLRESKEKTTCGKS